MKVKIVKRFMKPDTFKLVDGNPKTLQLPPFDVDGALVRPRRILQCDGGGILGIIPLFYLTMWCIASAKFAELMKSFTAIYGTSTGAIYGAALAMGKSPAWLLKTYVELGVDMFKGRKLIGKIFGGSRYDKTCVQGIIENVFGDETFKQLFERTGIELNITVFNCDTELTEIDNHKTTPDKMIKISVLSSMSAPTYFEPEKYKSVWYFDGGSASKNCTINDILNEAHGVENEVFILSMGCGYTKAKDKKDVSKMSYIEQIKMVFRAMRSATTTDQIDRLDRAKSKTAILSHRCDIEIPARLDVMDETENIDDLIRYVDK